MVHPRTITRLPQGLAQILDALAKRAFDPTNRRQLGWPLPAGLSHIVVAPRRERKGDLVTDRPALDQQKWSRRTYVST